MRKEQIFSLNLIRAMAIIMVMMNHTLSKNIGPVQDLFVVLGKTGVPLFLLLTGYLNSTKTVEDYYVYGKWKRCLDIVIAYLILGSFCYFGVHILYDKEYDIGDYVKKLLSFRATENGWYINMWLGLFFITPFLNAMIEKLRDIKLHKMGGVETAIITFGAFTVIPAFTNRNGNDLLPSYWIICFPVLYYLTGSYLRMKEFSIPKYYIVATIICICFGESIMNILIGGNKYLYFYGGHDSLVYLILSVSVFLLLKDVNTKGMCASVVNSISSLSLNIYLIGYLFDTLFYFLFCKSQDLQYAYQYFPYNLLCFIASTSCSFAVAYIYDIIYRNIKKQISK